MVAEAFAVTTDSVQYKPLERTGYTQGARSAQRLSIYKPSAAAGTYWVNRNHPGTYAYVLWFQKAGTLSPLGVVGGAVGNPGAEDITPSLALNTAGSTLDNLGLAAVAWQLLKNGVAIVPVRVTCPGDNTTDGTGTNPTGNGFLHAPGGVSNYYEGLTTPNARSDVVLAAQYMQYMAESNGLCKRAWGVMGDSAGGDLAAWLACAPNRAMELGSYGLYQESTVPNVFVGLNFVSTWWRYAALGTSNGNFPAAETGTGFDSVCASLTAAPQRYLREFSIASYLSDIGGECMPYAWLWSDIVSVSNNLNLPFTEDAQTAAHEAVTLIRLKHMVARGRVYVAVGDDGVVCNTSQSFSQFVDRVDMTGALPDEDSVAAVDQEGYDETYLNIKDPAHASLTGTRMDEGKAAMFILNHLNDDPWDSVIPAAGIGRRGQVSSIGRFVVPINAKRAGVRIKNTARGIMGFADLLWGESPYGATNRLRAGEEVVVPGQGPIWCVAAGDSTKVARFSAREFRSI